MALEIMATSSRAEPELRQHGARGGEQAAGVCAGRCHLGRTIYREAPTSLSAPRQLLRADWDRVGPRDSRVSLGSVEVTGAAGQWHREDGPPMARLRKITHLLYLRAR